MSDQAQETLTPPTPDTTAAALAEDPSAVIEPEAAEPEPASAEPEAAEASAEPEQVSAEAEAAEAPAEAEAAETPAEAEAQEAAAETEASGAEAAEAAPVEAAPVEAAPVEAAPVEAAPVEAAEAPAEAAEAPTEAEAAEAPAEAEAAEALGAEGAEAPDEAEAAEEEGSEEPMELKDLDISNQTPEMLALYHAMLEKRLVEGQVIGWNKGGYHVAIGKVAAFCPVSQIEIGNPRSPKRYLDKSFKFHVIEIQKGGRRVVLSRATALKAEREAIAAEVRETLKPGTVRKGKVSSVTDFGAFIDLGGSIEGLVHVSEISRKRVEHPKEVLKAGQEVEVVVLKLEKGGQRISLSMKRLEEDPWKGVADRFSAGDTFTGTVLRKTDFGIFVEVEPGLEGLVHNSRLPLGSGGPEDPSLEVGTAVEGWVHDVDAKRRRLSLSLRPLGAKNPWHGIEDRFPEGTIVKGRVERLAHFGAFIELEPGLTGLLPFSALGNAPANPRRQFHPGKEVSVRVLAIDREKRRISLGTESSQAEGSTVDYREYKKRQKGSSGGLNAMAAAFEKVMR